MTIANGKTGTKTMSDNAMGRRRDDSKTLALYAVGLALTLLLNWYVQPYTLFWG